MYKSKNTCIYLFFNPFSCESEWISDDQGQLATLAIQIRPTAVFTLDKYILASVGIDP